MFDLKFLVRIAPSASAQVGTLNNHSVCVYRSTYQS